MNSRLRSAQAAQARRQRARNSPILPGRSVSVVRVFLKSGFAAALVSAVVLYGWQNRPWPPPLQKVAPGSPALSVEEVMKTFFMPPGYGLEVVASEPLIRDPIVMDQDPDGRLYVIEMPAFAIDESMRDSKDPICNVVILEDTDNDGRMDKRTVFLDKLALPRAIKVLAGGVLVGEPPNLWLAKDTDGDGKADKKELIRNDFGRAEGNIEHNANGLYWGMDNTIYTSEHNWNLRWRHGKLEMEPGLVRGQWNISQDDGGRIYRNWNEQPLFVDYIPAKYFLRNPNVARTRGLYDSLIERNETAIWPVRPTPGIQRAYREGMLRPDGTATTYASSADPLIYRGDRLPKELYGNAFIGESPTNLVHRLIVTDDGTGRLKARDAYPKGEFLASTDERFRPVNLYGAADGTFYVIDMYRGVVQDIAYQTDYLNTYIKKNNLEMPVGMGRIYRVVHRSLKPGPKPGLSKAASGELMKTLAHPNGWWRDTAQQLLVQRDDPSIAPELKRLAAQAPDYRTRLHALWTLDGLDAIDPATVEKALSDNAADVRASAVRISERWLSQGNRSLVAAVLKKMDDPNWMVRRQLAASLGELPAAERLAPLTALLERYGADPITVDAAIGGLPAQESAVLDKLLTGNVSDKHGDAVSMLAAAIAKSKNEPAAQKIFQLASEEKRPAWQRRALLHGFEGGQSGTASRGAGASPGAGLGGSTGGGLRRQGSAAGPSVKMSQEPVALTRLAAGTGELSELAVRIASRLSWPAKSEPVPQAPQLTAEEQQRVRTGERTYANQCAGCHKADGTGNGGPTDLTASQLVAGNAGAIVRVILHGKEGAMGLMPPLGSALNDEQVAAVSSYLRRAWGHTFSPVAGVEVKEIRGITSLRKKPWTDDELRRLRPGPR